MDWKGKTQGMSYFKVPLLSRTEQLISAIQEGLNKALVVAWIFVGSMWPVLVSVWTTTIILSACSSDNVAEELKDVTPPTITLSKTSMEVAKGKTIAIHGKMLHIGNDLVASWSDDRSETCQVALTLNWKAITSWTILNEAGTLTITVSDEAGNASKADVKLSIIAEPAISWLEKLKNLSLQVDQEIDLLKWATLWNWAELLKFEIKTDWQTSEISNPHHYTPDYPWTCNIIITIKDKDGNISAHKVENLTIKPLEYKSLTIKNLKPADIMPFLWETKNIWGNLNIKDIIWYECIEHLRIVEATKIRDMMRQYGAGNHSPEQYQQLMSRLHTWMTNENPEWYSNYEKVWWEFISQPSFHAYNEWNILNSIVNHANFQIINNNYREKTLYELVSNNPNNIYIFGDSMSAGNDTNEYIKWDFHKSRKEVCKLPNMIFLITWSNIDNQDWILKNKILQQDISPDNLWEYWLASYANSENDAQPNKHILLTIWTNYKWNVDQTNEKDFGSKFPVWFHPDVLFAGREFPRNDFLQWCVWLDLSWKYQTSVPNYVNVAMMDLCFQMFAEVKDADELLNMVRSTSLTDHISLDWQTQALHLINPAGFFLKYLMPTKLPTSAKSDATVSLSKGYYKGVIFDIPGAEVKVDGEWIAYSDANKAQIKAQNPLTLEWRLNGERCKKMGYGFEKPVTGKIIVVDDKWNGLNITKEFSINLTP